MEFNEKLQELRKNKGLTQEELAEKLYVSRTAVSKWESGRGYPSIDSLKEISKFFSVSIDDLLSGEKLITLAEKENKNNIRNLCNKFIGITDLFYILMVVLPLYPNDINGFVYSVDLLHYVQTTPLNRSVYWIVFILLVLTGIFKLILLKIYNEKFDKLLTEASMAINVILVLFLALTRQVYAVVCAFTLLLVKTVFVIKSCLK